VSIPCARPFCAARAPCPAALVPFFFFFSSLPSFFFFFFPSSSSGEEEEEPPQKPLQGLLEDVKSDLSGVRADLTEVAAAADIKARNDDAMPASAAGSAPAKPRVIDYDAT